MSRTIAVCGKGGVGKTTVSALISRELRGRAGVKALIVDGDHAGGLALALGVESRRSINEVRRRTIEEIKGGTRDKKEVAFSIDYLLLEAVTELGNLAFLAVGRPEEIGCYCSVNSLLRKAIELLADRFDYVVIDAEAGIEQVNRQVMSSVDYLLLVSDPSAKGLKVAREIHEVWSKLRPGGASGLLLNRVRPEEEERVRAAAGLPVIGSAPEDEVVRRFDGEARSYLEAPDGPAAKAVVTSLVGAGVLDQPHHGGETKG